MIFDARSIARGWLSTALAASDDDGRPALTGVLVESFPEGVRLIATDSYMLLRSWVPAIDREDDPEPGLDETPAITAVALDPHRRGQGFLSHLLKLASVKNAPLYEVRLSLGVVEAEEGDAGSFAGMEATYVVFEHPDHERLKLRTYEGEYPDWRKLFGGFAGEATDVIALNPALLARVVKLGKLHGNKVLRWHFGGSDHPAQVDVADSEPYVDGLVMPCRWDLERHAPAVEATEETPES